MSLQNSLREFCTENLKGKNCWVAYSGGLDSQVLLALLNELRLSHDLNLHAIHIHHGLNPDADNWLEHCEAYCQQNEISFHSVKIDIDTQTGESLENTARQKRYQVLQSFLQQGDCLLTAHHQDDQAETLLVQLLRGAGPKGLASMPTSKVIGKGIHYRPLLNFSRKKLLEYAQEKTLSWVEDSSNSDTVYVRNFIRQDIMPLLKSRWPNIQATIARSANHCAETQHLIEEFAIDVYQSLAGSKPGTLSITKLLQLPQHRQRLCIRSWIYQSGFILPNSKKLASIERHILKARRDRKPHVCWHNVEVRRHKDDLYILKKRNNHDVNSTTHWDLTQSLILPNIGTLTATSVRGAGIAAHVTSLEVRFRRGGEIAYLPKRKHHDLKKLFQEWNVPTWERNRIPLLFHQDKLIAAVGYFIDPDFSANKDEVGRLVKWSELPP